MLELVFWIATGLLVYTHVGYPLVLWLLTRAVTEGTVPPVTAVSLRGQTSQAH